MSSSTIDIEPKSPVNVLKNGASKGVKAVGSLYEDFKNFINKGSVVDLAIGLIIGTAFSAVVNSVVSDLITPLIALALQTTSLPNAFVVMACPKSNITNTRAEISTCNGAYSTLAQAQTAGAITWNYGNFLQQILNFLVIALIVFFIVKAYSAFIRPVPAPPTKECPHCAKDIPEKATRCAFCTSAL